MAWLRGTFIACVAFCAGCSGAYSQELHGRFRPEKAAYMVGEPVFVVFELTNMNSNTVSVDDGACFQSFEAVAALQPTSNPGLYGCTGGGIAGSCAWGIVSLDSKETMSRRYLLPKSLPDEPGDYDVEAKRSVQIYAKDRAYAPLYQQDIDSIITIHMVPVEREALVAAYQGVLRDLSSAHAGEEWLAIQAVTDYPQPFLEDVVLNLSKNPQTAQAAIGGLRKLNTVRTKKRLAELAASDDEGIRQSAMTALGETNDPAYCDFMLQATNARRGYSASIAARAAGLLCGEKALRELIRGLQGENAIPAYEIAYALGNTGSRDAVPLLIDFLGQSDGGVRGAAEEALATLTHRTDEPAGGDSAYLKWSRFWSLYGRSVQVFRPDECDEEFESLPN